ncbi:flagellin [Agrobacterium tumefaciens]|uniref:flagellin N-terminal helical domain-containing protein n=1 Tax=Agrobacterium tumefaciens TaxID=358 RepID=UPI001F421594|nr:flagellin [Agrobacterium tumefaciens]
MTSILTNTSAMAALQTLRMIGSNMADTQQQVSSGLRVQTASDNAAYWSISTTMRSDNMAISAVADALGLGAAKIDVAYAGMETAIETTSQIKARLVAASDPALDKRKLQEEISQLQNQLRATADAASFSGQNWLKASLGAEDAKQQKSVVASFVRGAAGDVAVKTITYELNTETALFDTSPSPTGKHFGVLDKTARLEMAVGTKTISLSVSNYETVTPTTAELSAMGAQHFVAVPGYPETYYIAPSTEYAPLRDATGTIRTNASGEPLWTVIQVMTPANAALRPAEFDVQPYLDETGNHMTFDGNMHFYSIFGQPVTSALTVPAKTKEALELDGFTLFGATYSDGTKTYVDATGANDWVEVMTTAPSGSAANALIVGGTTYYVIEAPVDDTETRLVDFDFSVVTLDLTKTADIATVAGANEGDVLHAMLAWVDKQLQTLTASASTLGAIKTRIDMQQGFAKTLMDSIDKGISRLIDADMNEASTRLKALQTQEQLAIQSLQIANSNVGNIMQLFS